jgi:hypothetical protein
MNGRRAAGFHLPNRIAAFDGLTAQLGLLAFSDKAYLNLGFAFFFDVEKLPCNSIRKKVAAFCIKTKDVAFLPDDEVWIERGRITFREKRNEEAAAGGITVPHLPRFVQDFSECDLKFVETAIPLVQPVRKSSCVLRNAQRAKFERFDAFVD